MVKIPKDRVYVPAKSYDSAVGKFSDFFKNKNAVIENIRYEGTTIGGKRLYSAKVRQSKRSRSR